MKYFIGFLLLLIGIVAQAEDGDITTKAVKHKDAQGRVFEEVETTYRRNVEILETTYVLGTNQTIIQTNHIYFLGGDIFEEGKNAQGQDLTCFIHVNTNNIDTNNLPEFDVEEFMRQTNGALVPVPTSEIEKFKGECMFGALMKQSTANHLLREVPSPDGKLKAVAFDRNCGAPCSPNYNISILKHDETLPVHTEINTFFTAEAEGELARYFKQIKINWISTTELHVAYPVGQSEGGPRVYQTNSTDGPVKITYKSFPVK